MKAIAYAMERSERCDLCGTAEWEWDENKRAYEPVEKFCHGCYLKGIAQSEVQDAPGTTITLAPTTGRAAAQRLVKAKASYETKRTQAIREPIERIPDVGSHPVPFSRPGVSR